MNNVLLIMFLSAFGSCKTITDNQPIIYSYKVKDSFEIYISLPPKYDSSKSYNVIYYCDANLKSGKLLRELMKESEFSKKVNNNIFVGIGHIGDYRVLRRRDFILPINKSEKGDNLNYGQIENFYQFLTMELIPRIDSTYSTNKRNNSIIGHSLGGLFVFYCLFKGEDVFTNYYALSPSLWIDYYSIYKYDKLSQNDNTKNLYFSAGGMEVFNRIKSGTNQMNEYLKAKNYMNLRYKYQVHEGKTHNSQVEKSLKHIMEQ